jgi:hypothetical protein
MAATSIVTDFADAPRSFRLATAIVGFAETLRQSPHAGGLDQALSIAERAKVAESRDEAELITLMKRAIELGASRKPLVAAQ